MIGEKNLEVPPLVIEQVMIRYGRITAVREISLTIPTGSVYALLGRNGSGKTSMVRCLIGHQKPTSGRILLFGKDVWSNRAAAMARIGVIPEIPDIPPDMTILQLEAFCRRLHPRWSRRIFVEFLERFEVPVGISYTKLSKGERRMMSLAVALGTSPELLVLDDPTLGLDVVARKVLFEELVGELADRGTTIFLTTHDLAGIEGLADCFGILHRGELVLDESAETLKQRFRRLCWADTGATITDETEQMLRPMGLLHTRVHKLGCEALVTGFETKGFERLKAAVGQGVLDVQSLSLEEIFLTICGEDKGVKS